MTSIADLVSVAMPCHNAAASLPMSLASLLAQEHTEWECLLVDDGSDDNPRAIVEQFDDPRIRYLRLNANRGPGVARQVALEHARGAYLAMLDADDWFYPAKLRRQVEALSQDSRPVLVSAGMAILDRREEIVGVRACGPAADPPLLLGPWRRLGPPPVAHAPSMIRMTAARGGGYDPRLRRSEDADFLFRVMWDRPYTILAEVAYACTEYRSVTLQKLIAGYRNRARLLWRYRDRGPARAMAGIAASWAKEFLFRMAYPLGAVDRLIARRSRRPAPDEIADYQRALQAVQAVLAGKHLDGSA